MKTIDLLVQELPALGGWPDGAVEAGFLCSDDTLFFVNKDGDCPSGWRINMNHEVEDSWIEVTREQYEAALAEKEHPLPWDEKNKPCPTIGAECRGCPDCGRRVSCTSDDITDDAVRTEMGMNSRALDAALAAKNDGWIEWGGGECPVERGVLVEVKYRNEKNYHIKGVNRAWEWSWEHHGTEGDIIAYRLHQPQEAEQAKADDEVDLNECIGQDAAPVWNGEGLPPVGCECEYLDSNNKWYPVTIKYVSNQIVVICGMTNIFEEEQETEIAKDIQLDKPQFRPIRSEADRKRDAAVGKIFDVICKSLTDESESTSFAIYDAIAAGKIPGVKLDD